jgi:Leucine-rich repeat (LRR) protein
MKKYYFLIIAFWFFGFVNGQIINFPDANFKAKLLAANSSNQIAKNLAGDYFKIDANDDGEIQESEALQVFVLDVSSSMISSLAGVSFFTNLVTLYCFSNQLTNLNVNNLNNIQYLYCESNQLTSLNLSGSNTLRVLSCSNNLLASINIIGSTVLRELYCDNNQLSILNLTNFSDLIALKCSNNLLANLDLNNCSSLVNLSCNNNQLTNLNLSTNTALFELRCNSNQLSSLDLNNNVELAVLYCDNNLITSLNLVNNTNLNYLICNNNLITNLNTSFNPLLANLNCSNNQITILDLNNNKALNTLYCTNNQLTNLYVKNGRNENTLVIFQNNPNLQYICADTVQIPNILFYINYFGLNASCNVNDYCSFMPGGTFYTLKGISKLDIDNNGCSSFDLSLPNMKYNITNGTATQSLISNNLGNYLIPLGIGTYTTTPILQNPTYFNVSPTSATITFPATASPATQNFCITPNGNHQDLEVTLLPLNPARPGFDCRYKIIYKNIGNITMNGNVIFRFNDLVLDLLQQLQQYQLK